MAGIDDLHLSDTVKKIFLAGVGAVAAGAEKGRDVLDKSKGVIDELVKKGEITVEQGKALNQELKHRDEQKKEDVTKKEESAQGAEAAASEKKTDLDALLAGLTQEEREALKAKLNSGDDGSSAETGAEETPADAE